MGVRQSWLSAAALLPIAVAGCASNASTNDRAAADDATTPCAPATDASVTVSYEAVTADGHYVVVFGGPRARVFYGTAENMVEGRITDTSQSCAQAIDFTVAGTSYGAVFAPSSCNGNVQSRLAIGEGVAMVRPLTVLIGFGPPVSAPGSVAPAELHYFCF
jgi:hypothetical protein